MYYRLPADCLNEIFEYLEDDKITLRSCILVNRLCCEIAIRILWRNVWSFQYSIYYKPYRTHVPLTMISTLIGCLPNESKDLLYNNEILITTPTCRPSLFNYPSFCKVLSIYRIDEMILHVLKKQECITSKRLDCKKHLLSQEILKMFMSQITSLKFLDYGSGYPKNVQNVKFTYFPGARNCLKNLTELSCSSDICSEFFHHLSQICHNIRSLIIKFGDVISNGLSDLISLQNNLKSVTLQCYENEDGIEVIMSSLTKFSSTLTKLTIRDSYIPLSFIAIFTNLQELILSFDYYSISGFEDFNQLRYVTFSQLKVLKFLSERPISEILIKFLEVNGKNLNELYIGDSNNGNSNSLNLAIARFCPNLKTLSTLFLFNEVEALKVILNCCHRLEAIKIWCGEEFLYENEILDVIAKYSPKNFYELNLYYDYNEQPEIPSEDLESFFICWKDRIPQKPLSLIIIKDYECTSLELNEKAMEVIEKNKKLGVIKKIETKKFNRGRE